MARTGRPPTPTEVKRRRGTARPDRTPALASVVTLRMAPGVPEPPAGLGPDGLQLWSELWAEAITWLSPDSDTAQMREACHLADDVARARYRYRATSDPADLRAVTAASKSLTEALSALGFNPTARSRLGLAEVKAVDRIDQILNRRKAKGAS